MNTSFLVAFSKIVNECQISDVKNFYLKELGSGAVVLMFGDYLSLIILHVLLGRKCFLPKSSTVHFKSFFKHRGSMLTDAKTSVPGPGQKSVEKFLQN